MGLLRRLAPWMMRHARDDVTFEGSGIVPDARLATTPVGPVFPMTTHPGIIAMAQMLGVDLQPPQPDIGKRMSWPSHGRGGIAWRVSTPGRSTDAGRNTHLSYWIERSYWMNDLGDGGPLLGFGTDAHWLRLPRLTNMVIRLSMESVPETIALTLVGKRLDETFGYDTGRHDLKVVDTTQREGVMTLHISDHDDVPIPVSSTRPPERSREALIKLTEGPRA